jgi:hypothetical protein
MESNARMLPSRHGPRECSPDRPVAVTVPADGERGPTFRSIIVLAISALALIATTPAQPSIAGRVIGEVVLDGGQSVERELRIHVDPEAGDASGGSIYLSFQAASGLQTSYTRDATLGFVAASDTRGSFEPSATIPIERCVSGCDLAYRIRIATARDVLPGSLIRYEVDVSLRYSGYGPRDQSLMRVDVDGAASGPVAPIWAVLAGLLALVGGIGAGPAVHRRLEPGRRRAPGVALLALTVGLIAWLFIDAVRNVVKYATLDLLAQQQLGLFLVADPWSVILLGTLGWGIWRGLRRWPTDGGWLLGLSAVATVGLGGLWLAWRLTSEAVLQPFLVTMPFVLLGSVGGIVIGQAWRTDKRADHDRWWGALAVLSHGVVIAGFGFLAEQSFFDPFATSPMSLLALIPAALVTLAFRRWLRGQRFWLALFDFMIAATGLLGLWLWSSTFIGFTTTPARLEIDDVAVCLAVAAAVVAVVTSFHPMPGEARIAPIEPVTPLEAVDDPPTT